MVNQSSCNVSSEVGIRHITKSNGVPSSSLTTTPLITQSERVTPELKNHLACSMCTPPSAKRAVDILACGTLASGRFAPPANTSSWARCEQMPTRYDVEFAMAATQAVDEQPLDNSAITST